VQSYVPLAQTMGSTCARGIGHGIDALGKITVRLAGGSKGI